MRFKKIIKLFESGNVCVTGLRGTGKDLVIGNVINRRKKPYISNLDYTEGKGFMSLDLTKFDIKNDYNNFIKGDINFYDFPYLRGSDVYISDCGVYFPSQYNGQLNSKYPTFPNYQALSRQVGEHNFHINAQNLNRVWDKIREQSDKYIMCCWCFVLFKKIVIQKVTIYDKYQSCIDRVKKPRVKIPLFNREAKMHANIYLDNHINTHGIIKNGYLIYWNKSKHDTLYFGNLLRKGKK